MKIVLRQLTTLLLGLLIAFTSVQLAAARGQSPAVSTMVICTGTGPVHILVDEDGQPTGRVMICPDYAVAFFAEVSHVTPAAIRLDRWQDLWLGQPDEHCFGAGLPPAQARGPPPLV